MMEMFNGPISLGAIARFKGLFKASFRPIGDFHFQLERTNFNECLQVWKIKVPDKFKADLLKL